jgi:hypothetical protein
MTASRGAARIRVARTFAFLGLLLLASGPALVAHAQDEANVLERRVKAAFVFKFTSYVEWPAGAFPQADTPVTIAVVGDDELAAELAQTVAGRTVDGRPLLVRKPKGVESLADVHMLFVGRAEIARLSQWVKSTQSKPVLIITDVPGALNQGGMINFVVIQQRVRFEISLDEAEKRGLRLSSRLLAVAQSVRRVTPP